MKEIKFKLDIENIEEIPFHKYDQNFTFIVDGKRYQTNRVVADILSPKLRKLHFSDESLNEFYIDTKIQSKLGDKNDYFSEFLNLTSFNEIKLDSNHLKFYMQYFYALGNIDSFLKMKQHYCEELTVENAVDRLLEITQDISNNGCESDLFQSPANKIITFISEKIENIDKNKIKMLNISILEQILRNVSLQLHSEDSLLQLILSLYEENHECAVLFDYVIFSNLSKKCFESFIQEFEIEDMNNSIWKSICSRILSPEKNTTKDKSRYIQITSEFEYQKGKDFNGIMNFLTGQTGSNIHDNGTINITSNSIVGLDHPKNLVDYKNNNYYYAGDEGGAIICFDFKDKKVQLTSYSMKSYDQGPYENHLKNWVIEVSNDLKIWNEIDRHQNDPTLNGKCIIANFKIKKPQNEFYRYIRLRQTGNSWNEMYNHNYFIFYFMEFFGKINYFSSEAA